MEEWKTIIDYTNYSISSLCAIRNDKTKRIMKLSLNTIGYLKIGLCKNGIKKMFLQHQLMGLHFILNPNNYNQIDHINNIKDDNRLENLRWVNSSQNNRNKKKKINCSSQYLGVNWYKKNNKWVAKISINRKRKHLGYFATELEAFAVWKAFVIQNNLQEFYSQMEF